MKRVNTTRFAIALFTTLVMALIVFLTGTYDDSPNVPMEGWAISISLVTWLTYWTIIFIKDMYDMMENLYPLDNEVKK